MNKINRPELLDKTSQIIRDLFPATSISTTDFENHNSFFELRFYLLSLSLAVQISVDLMDKLLTFSMLRLDENKRPFSGYRRDLEGKLMRIDWYEIFTYLKLPLEKKRYSEIFHLPSDFQLKDNCNELLLKKIKEGFLFYAPILSNEQSILNQLQDLDTWEKIGK